MREVETPEPIADISGNVFRIVVTAGEDMAIQVADTEVVIQQGFVNRADPQLTGAVSAVLPSEISDLTTILTSGTQLPKDELEPFDQIYIAAVAAYMQAPAEMQRALADNFGRMVHAKLSIWEANQQLDSTKAVRPVQAIIRGIASHNSDSYVHGFRAPSLVSQIGVHAHSPPRQLTA